MNHSELAKKIVEQIGGESNITRAWHCVTRLRFHVKDEQKVNLTGIKEISDVMGAQFQNGQLQIIIGNKVADVFKEIEAIVGLQNKEQSVDKNENKKGMASRFLDMISGVFSPVIPAIAGAGMMKGFLALLQVTGWISQDSDAFQVLTIISNAAFYFLPFLLAISAAKRFNVSEYLAVAISGALLYPTITAGVTGGESGLDFLGMPIPFIDYSATVIPVILMVWILSYVYQWINRIIPNALRIVLTPTLVFMIMIPFALIVAGPIGFIIGDYVGIGVGWLYEYGGVMAGIIVGGLLPLFIVTGMHYGFAPLILQNMSKSGFDPFILPLNIVNSLSQAGAAFAVSLKTKNKKFKSIAVSSGISALLGVTEPAIFGVSLKLRRPLYATMISSAISGGFAMYFGIKCFGFVAQGLEAFPVYIDPADSMNLVYTGISVFIAFVLGFIFTVILGFEDVPSDDDTITDHAETEESTEINTISEGSFPIGNPLKGTHIPLNELTDKTFSEEVLGTTVAIQPTENLLVSPFDGRVVMLYPTKHAIGLKSDTGVEILIHIGLETVNLDGEHFEIKVTQGEVVKKGQELITFDRKAITDKGYNMVTLIIVTNNDQFTKVDRKSFDAHQAINKEETILTTIK
ncbi:beta-glucoside-specific PTS transporter subunit IIABC [Paraliobacillus sediminis]|uniref:beta-glucoside-specific PTS transporter subunit IIABC n=1 Tax=Paraliobacillus sediminis TaxID=1885916 RepID=UPI000E3CA5E5|nr:beta-glucoside-specific PTS transporter subunit IIABC [Paraliobacillus sediminis]